VGQWFKYDGSEKRTVSFCEENPDVRYWWVNQNQTYRQETLRRYDAQGRRAGSISVALFLVLTGRDPYFGLNAGFIALCCNFAVTGVVSGFTRMRVAGFDEALPAAATSRS
jgi:hypothetical protein